jgi:hypothetical protein
MKRRVLAGLSILAVIGSVGWKLASHPETSTGLQEVKLAPHSEHSQPDSTHALAGIRIRLSPGDLGYQIPGTNHKVPQIPLAGE